MREAKKYRLRQSLRPKKHKLLSGVVRVADSEGIGYSFVSFDESFVDAVGKALPRGLTEQEPAYLKVLYLGSRNTWRTYAMYLREEVGVLLWETEGKPSYIGKIKRV